MINRIAAQIYCILAFLLMITAVESQAATPATLVIEVLSGGMMKLPVRINNATHTFTDDEGNSNIVFLVNVQNTPQFCEWVTQKNCNVNNVSFKIIRKQEALALIKNAYDTDDRLMWNTLAAIKKDDEI